MQDTSSQPQVFKKPHQKQRVVAIDPVDSGEMRCLFYVLALFCIRRVETSLVIALTVEIIFFRIVFQVRFKDVSLITFIDICKELFVS